MTHQELNAAIFRNMAESYILTIQGCPFAFASAGVDLGQLPTGSSDWPVGVSSSYVIKAGLDPDSFGSWNESLDLLEATFQGGGLNFRLNDKVVSYVGADRNLATYLFTRNDQEETQLSATLSASVGVGGTFTVEAPHSLTGTNFVAWVEGEAILCASVSTNTVTVAARGFYGTKVLDHKLDRTSNYKPTVWVEYPGVVKHDVKLWRVDSSNVGSVIWRGTCQRAPRLSSGGSQIELQCEHIWTKLSQTRYMIPDLTTKFHGVDGDGVKVRFAANGVPSTFYNRLSAPRTPILNRWSKNVSVRDSVKYVCQDMLHQNPYAWLNSTTEDGDDGLLVTSVYSAPNMDVLGFHGPVPMSPLVESSETDPNSIAGFYKIKLKIRNRDVYQTFENGGASQMLVAQPWSTTEDVPEFTSSGSLTTCLTRPVLFSELKEDQDVFPFRNDALMYYYPTSYEIGAASQDLGLVFVSGSALFYPKDLSDDFDGSNQDLQGVAEPEQIKFKYSLTSRHWLDVFRYGIVERYEDVNNWDFSKLLVEKLTVQTAPYKTELVLDGTETYQDLFSTFGKLFGCMLTTTSGSALTFKKVEQPSLSSRPVAVFTTQQLVEAPNWELNPESLVTTVIFKSEGFSGEDKQLVFNDKGAISRYGQGETVEIDLSKLGHSERWIVRNKEQLGIIAYSRFFQMFGKPFDRVTFKVDIRYLNAVFPGQVVTLSDWIIPSGTGTRGLSSKKVLVVERTVDLKEATVEFVCLSFTDNNTRGWSPCVKLSAVSIVGKLLTVTGSYLAASTGQVTDYAGSTLTPYAGTANDAGISFFTTGDRAELILRDSTTYSTFPVTISSVGASTISINETITTGSVDWPAQAVSGNVDLRFNAYNTSGMQTTQLEYGFVGNQATGQIQTLVKNQRFR